MNRIILIGNGFDLAHGMATSYKNFIDDYWEQTIQEIKKNGAYRPFENGEIHIKRAPVYWPTGNSYKDLINTDIDGRPITLTFKNQFLKIITEKNDIQNWVDVEDEYYRLLIESSNNRNTGIVKKLNENLRQIKQLLADYLTRIENSFSNELNEDQKKIISQVSRKISEPFNFNDFSEASTSKKVESESEKILGFINEIKSGTITLDSLSYENQRLIPKINSDHPHKLIKKLLKSESALNYFELPPDNILYLNFNYTSTFEKLDHPYYEKFIGSSKINTNSIYIHGMLKNPDSMVFGFGDELDEQYKIIENLNDNAYLENIKSINYLETNSYKRLLEYINGEEFQIFIFGHSCGISDRTLLNTLFEHENCASIKVFYHKRNDGSDNYSDIVRNISRNFNDKALMRDRVVNKNYCEPLLDIRN